MNHPLPRGLRAVLLAAFVAAGCHGCQPAPPDQYQIEALHDPYEALGPQGQMPRAERAARVIDAVARPLGYGSIPADFLRRQASEAWLAAPIPLIASGQVMHLKAAWAVVGQAIVTNQSFTGATRFKAKQAQARIWDYENTHQPEAFMKKAYLSEIAWCFYLIRGLGQAGGNRP